MNFQYRTRPQPYPGGGHADCDMAHGQHPDGVMTQHAMSSLYEHSEWSQQIWPFSLHRHCRSAHQQQAIVVIQDTHACVSARS